MDYPWLSRIDAEVCTYERELMGENGVGLGCEKSVSERIGCNLTGATAGCQRYAALDRKGFFD